MKFKENKNDKKNISSLGASEIDVYQKTGFVILPDINIKKTNLIIFIFIFFIILNIFMKNIKLKK